MDGKDWLAIGALVVLALFIGRNSSKWLPFAAVATDTAETDAVANNQSQTPTIANGQAYYDIHLALSGSAYNQMSNEYFPLFGFVGARQM